MLIPKGKRKVFYLIYLLILVIAGFLVVRYIITPDVRQAIKETYLPSDSED